MKISEKFWRALFCLVFLAALCGSFPAAYVPVSAAPQLLAATNLVISEFRFRGSGGATDEFVEIFNPTGVQVNLNGWKVNGSNNSGTTGNRYTFSTDTFLQPGQHYLLSNIAAVDGVTADVTYGTGITADGGVALLRPDNSIADAVGLSNGSAYKEGTVLSSITTDVDQSYERKPGGASSCLDDNNNATDFQLLTTSNPQNSSTTASPCTAVTNVSATTADGTYTTGAGINITVIFNGAVTVTGNPTLLLETGTTDRSALYSSGSGSDTLTFLYTVVAGDSSTDLDYVASDSLALNGGTITGATGDAVLVLPTPGSAGSLSANKNIVIDNGVAPAVTVNQATGQSDPTGALPINFDVEFSEAIDVSTFNTADITQTGTATGITWSIIDSGDHINFTLRATAVTGAGTLIPSIPAGSVTDTAGNINTASTSTDNTVTYAPTAALTVVINEVAWAGTVAESNDEWIELYNPSGTDTVDVTGWVLRSSDGTPNITLNGTLDPNEFLVFARNPGTFAAAPAVTYTANSSVNLSNNGEILTLVDKNGATVDTANGDGGTWPAGIGSPTYASMERVGTTSHWITYAGTVPVAYDRESFAVKGTPGRGNWISTTTVTTITSDTPDPSLVNQSVKVTVTVVGGLTIPTGSVAITGTNGNCTITLSNGSGNCSVKFTSLGTKTISATYNGDSTHPPSIDTETHQVSTTTVVTPTRIPTIPPPPPLVAINEFVPRPGHDWNNDGEVTVQDEYIEIINHGVVDVNLSGYKLDDEANLGSDPYNLPAKVVRPGERVVFYGSETGLLLSDGGDGVRLLKPNGQLMDAYNYTVARYPDQSYCRLPDNGGLDDWNQNCYPTPGLQNSLSGEFVSPPGGSSGIPLCPIADTLPDDFVFAECTAFGNNIWRQAFWDATGWYNEKILPRLERRWDVFAD